MFTMKKILLSTIIAGGLGAAATAAPAQTMPMPYNTNPAYGPGTNSAYSANGSYSQSYVPGYGTTSSTYTAPNYCPPQAPAYAPAPTIVYQPAPVYVYQPPVYYYQPYYRPTFSFGFSFGDRHHRRW